MASANGLFGILVRAQDALRARKELSKALRNSVWLLLDRVLRLVVGFVVSVWLARYLGPDRYGVLSYAIAFIGLVSVIATLPIQGLIVRELVRHPEARGELLGSAWAMRLAGAAAGLTLSVSAILLLRPGDIQTAWLVAVLALAPFFQSTDVIDSWFEAQVASRYSVTARAGAFLIFSCVRVALILGGATVVAFAWAIVGEAAFAAIAMVWAYRISGARLSDWRASARRTFGLLRQGWPLLISSAAIMIHMRVDQVMLGEFGSFQDVGAYSVAVRLVEMWYTVPMVLTASLFPTILRSKELGEVIYVHRIRMLYGLMLWMGMGVALTVSLASGWIINLLYGPAYASAAPALALMCWTAVWVFFGVARTRWLFAENALRAGMAVEVVRCLLNVLLNLALIPRLGAIGAATAALSAATAANLLVACFSPTIRRSLFMLVSSAAVPFQLVRTR